MLGARTAEQTAMSTSNDRLVFKAVAACCNLSVYSWKSLLSLVFLTRVLNESLFTRVASVSPPGAGEPVPEHPYPGQHWKEVRHDRTVTWLAFWKDPISQKDFKYVWLAANSTFKSDSDLAKYEKARKLKVNL